MTGFVSRIKQTATSNSLFLATALLVALAAAAPLFFNSGLLNTRGGGDSPFLLQRLQQMTVALGDGHFPVRWMPDANYGYGYPFFNYYAPLSVYIAALFRFLGASYVLAVKLAQLSGFVVAAWGMFVLGRRWLGNYWAGLLAAAAYTLAPFHMVNVYVRGDSLAEFWAMAFYPLVVLAVDRLAQATLTAQRTKESASKALRLGIALLALVYAALILSHNISALIFTPFLLLYLLFDGWQMVKSSPALRNGEGEVGASPGKGDWRQWRGMHFLWVAAAIMLALALAAWFWLPALAESSLAQLEPVTRGYFHYSNHFRELDLVQRPFLFDYDPTDGRVFSMGLVQAAAVLAGASALLLRGRRRPNAVSRGRQLYIVAGLLLATLMITSLSTALWDNLPLLSFTQFPWRFLSIQAFFGALATAGLALLSGRRLIVPLTVILLLVTSLAGLKLDFLPLTDADVTSDKLAQYEWYTGNIGTTISAEYLPEYVQPRPYTSPWLNKDHREAVRVLEGEVVAIDGVSLKSTRQEWQIVAGDAGATITLPTLAWPGWTGSVDGAPADLESGPGSGLITVSLTPGEHQVELHLARTPVRLAGEGLALIALITLSWLLARSLNRHPGRGAVYVVGSVLLLMVILRLLPEASRQNDDLNWDFAQMAYLHHADQGILYENGARLVSYSYNKDELSTGETLIVTLNWLSGAAEQARISLTTPASNRNFRAPLFARQSQEISPGTVRYELAVPENAPSGLVMPRLTVFEVRPLTPSGLSRRDVYLRPVLLRDRPQPAEAGEATLDARAFQVLARNDQVLELQLQWLTRRPLSHSYNYSLRIVDGAGRDLVQLDGQPGSGFLPSSGWPAGQWVDDWIAMTLPQGFQASAPDGPFDLVARLYEVGSGDVVLTRLLGQLAWQEDLLHFKANQPTFALPAEATPLAVNPGYENGAGPAIGLAGYHLNQDDERLELALYWIARSATGEDLYHFVHLEDAGGAIVAQHDGLPRHGSYPTSQWLAGEIVTDAMGIDISQLPAGEYALHVGLYRLQNGQAIRVPLSGAEAQSAPDQRLQLPEQILIRR